MKKIGLGIKILLGSMLLWAGGFVLLFLLIMLFESTAPMNHLHSGNEIPVNIALGTIILAVLIRIFAAWKKRIGDDIHTGVFVLLNLLAGVPSAVYVWMYMHSFD